MSHKTISLRKLCQISSEREVGTRLCNRCSRIRLRMRQGLPVNDDLIFLGSLRGLEERRDCMLCRLIVQSLPSRDTTTDGSETQYILNPRYIGGESFALMESNSTSTAVKAWIRIECPPGILDGFSGTASPMDTLSSQSLSELSTKNLTIDARKIRSWVKECETNHGAKCDGHKLNTSARKTSEMLLIDVFEDKMVPGDQDSRYVVLSYVWGSLKSSDLLRTKSALRSPEIRLPNVLRDAMALTRSIGERYLWCDALSEPVFTIAVLSGQHGDQPIAGVHRGSRKPIVLIAELDRGLNFVSRALMLGSTYESRAWTFQEKLLSPRCLFITEKQAYFQCAATQYREDEDICDFPETRKNRSLLYSPEGISLPSDPDRSIVFSSLYTQTSGLTSMLEAMIPFDLYSSLVYHFTNRKLTETRDILNAFGGISKVLEVSFDSSFCYGLPSIYLDEALLWTPQLRLERRVAPSSLPAHDPILVFPSWSWAGWIGQVSYRSAPVDQNAAQHLLKSKIILFPPQDHEPFKLVFEAYTLDFSGILNFEGGQLFCNTFSTKSQLTTHDGKYQCDISAFTFSADLGVSPDRRSSLQHFYGTQPRCHVASFLIKKKT
ncbi:uncharacterized protein BDZ99DRAFT_553374 [Mytilinidion resinicola]|uniref:Heterokaryon incompatibility domain-containing protein n=1 Tax=Mytilinidion resinicola TaxID=574789 RepID=A0A6A6XYX5_9PEZI|nr:uncharacterized protein BDZ99DRAFT_553374 [Mytilinidion resinicola]KAF2801488.1 hypothetical protein BDZ99DRAFT_553374 [Mytilinidion resinicola]